MSDKLTDFYRQSPETIALQVTIFLLVAYFSARLLHDYSKSERGMARKDVVRQFARRNAVRIKRMRIASLLIGVLIYSVIFVTLIMQDFGIFMVPMYALAAFVNLPIIAGRVILPLLPWERYMQKRNVIGSTVGLIVSVFLFICVDLFVLVQVFRMVTH